MKKVIFIVIFIFSFTLTFAQSQRLVLLEEFTNASCPPCASQNPAFNVLLSANTAKVVAVKYQTDWPGYDPMNAQNPDQADDRVSYYSETSVPTVKGDGNVFDNSPSAMTQTWINNEYAVASPFDLSVSHYLSADYDSIFITIIISCTQSVSGTLKLHTIVEEEEINFTSAPGGNGETEFYDVMRIMFPSSQGASLASSWTAGQSDTFYYAEPLPDYIYNVNEICVVAFIQNNSDKNVKQAGLSAVITQPTDVNLDASISAISNAPIILCSSTLSPTIVLKNLKSTALTSATVYWQLDNDSIYSQVWSGTLTQNMTTNIIVPSLSITDGSHTFKAWVEDQNGNADLYLYNDYMIKDVNVVTVSSNSPLTEGFQSSVPPTSWVVYNPDADLTWANVGYGGFGNSSKSAFLNFFSINSGNYDELFLPSIDLTDASNAELTFSVAYARYDASYYDRLQVLVTTNCGTSWQTLYSKSGSTLATAADHSSQFTPLSSEWRSDTIALSSYEGQSDVIIKFKGESGYGNNLFIDDVNVSFQTSGIKENINKMQIAEVFPNPFSNIANIDINLYDRTNCTLDVFNSTGMLVYHNEYGELPSGYSRIIFDGSSCKSGLYYFVVTAGDEIFSTPVSLIK